MSYYVVRDWLQYNQHGNFDEKANRVWILSSEVADPETEGEFVTIEQSTFVKGVTLTTLQAEYRILRTDDSSSGYYGHHQLDESSLVVETPAEPLRRFIEGIVR